jgi:hypothetical protein
VRHTWACAAARAGRQDELLKARQLCVVVGQRVVELQQRIVLEQLIARHGQLAAQVEQLVLDVDQQVAHILGHWLAQQQADMRVQFIHIAHGMRAAAVLGNAGVVSQAGGSVISGAGGDLRRRLPMGHPLSKLRIFGAGAARRYGRHCALQPAGKCSLRQQQAKMLALCRLHGAMHSCYRIERMPFMNKKNLLNCKGLVIRSRQRGAVLCAHPGRGHGFCADRRRQRRQNKEPVRIVQSGAATGVQQAPPPRTACRRPSSVPMPIATVSSVRRKHASCPSSQRFEEIDSDRNGQLSRAEFDKGAQRY